MALFQTSVLNQYLKLQDATLIQKAYKKYSKYFHNVTIQENIRNSKEEEYQGIFLTELFVNILGYTLSPKPDYNLVAEYKNLNNARKADGAILKDNIAIGVIELKGTNTKDLESIRRQAFDYKVNHKGCTYIITSNFEKLRFYINDATEFEEFNLFELTESSFSLLYLCLHKQSIFKNLPLKIKEASLIEEELITKKFYNDYSLFKRELFRDLVKRNAKTLKSSIQSQIVSMKTLDDEVVEKELIQLEKSIKLTLFKKSQKLIDRFLFIFFSEDRGLLPANSTVKILNDWNKLKDLEAVIPLYDRFKLYFKYLDTGRKGTEEKSEIYAYNGGLFKSDSILDTIEISDELLYKYTKKIANYDFDSQVDVNILGHIFENSLNEIESINAEIEGGEFDKQKSKRKKDGVFYTPKYITKYIVENTIGKLCEDKKVQLGFKEEEYYKSRSNRHEKTIKKLIQVLDNYREWLLQLTICDPACGSGAFLNQALDFLIKEHSYIDELKTKLLGGGFQFPDIENTILENNIYGVDLNEESVEIAKLSLWLRTAQPRRKLNDLSNNIKCGNSLIETKALAGGKAFNWNEEFVEVFSNGGFDIIIGNPPYGAKLEKEVQKYLVKRYINGGSETVISFLKLSHELLKNGGSLGFIIPKSFSFSSNYKSIREFLIEEIDEVVDCGKVWSEVKLEQVIVSFNKFHKTKTYQSSIRNNQEIFKIGNICKSTFDDYQFILNGISEEELSIGETIRSNKLLLKEISTNQRGGPLQRFIGNNGKIDALGGANIQREGVKNIKGKVELEDVIGDNKIFINKNSVLVQNIVSHINRPVEHIKITACTINEHLKNYVILDTINQISLNTIYSNQAIKSILNSRIINWYVFRFIYGKAIRTMHFDNAVTSRIPIPELGMEFKDRIHHLSIELDEIYMHISETEQLFENYILASYNLNNNLNYGILNYCHNDFKKFIKKLNSILFDNNSEHLKKEEEIEWFDIFQKKTHEITVLQKNAQIKIDEIDNILYNLYGLNQKQITLVKNQMP